LRKYAVKLEVEVEELMRRRLARPAQFVARPTTPRPTANSRIRSVQIAARLGTLRKYAVKKEVEHLLARRKPARRGRARRMRPGRGSVTTAVKEATLQLTARNQSYASAAAARTMLVTTAPRRMRIVRSVVNRAISRPFAVVV